jgi:hypothetical protein
MQDTNTRLGRSLLKKTNGQVGLSAPKESSSQRDAVANTLSPIFPLRRPGKQMLARFNITVSLLFLVCPLLTRDLATRCRLCLLPMCVCLCADIACRQPRGSPYAESCTCNLAFNASQLAVVVTFPIHAILEWSVVAVRTLRTPFELVAGNSPMSAPKESCELKTWTLCNQMARKWNRCMSRPAEEYAEATAWTS